MLKGGEGRGRRREEEYERKKKREGEGKGSRGTRQEAKDGRKKTIASGRKGRRIVGCFGTREASEGREGR